MCNDVPVELNPFSYEFHENPWPTYRWLRDHAPLYRNEALDFWALSRFRDVMDALVDWESYSSTEGVVLERLDPRYLDATPMMIFIDPPRHDRLRKLVSRAFTPRRVAALEPFVRDTAARLLEPLVDAGGGDFVRDFSTPLPMEVIFTLLGVPDADRLQLREWTDLALDRDPDSAEVPPRAVEAMMQSMRYWYELLPELRRRPNDGLICALFDAEIETDDGGTTRLTDGEVIGFCSLLGAAGSETTTKLLANAAVLFARHGDAWGEVLADPGRLPNAIEEILRYTSPAQYNARTVTRDVEWYGQRVPAGARILLLIGAANRDERQYPDPDRFDIHRDIPNQLALGQGVHFCLGASLARLETRVALEEFARRFPRYAVDEAGCRRVHMSNVHGFSNVPFTRR
jgi:cytochrome P450